MLKRILSMITCGMLLLVLVSCGGNDNTGGEGGNGGGGGNGGAADTDVTLTINVKDESGAAISGIVVQLVDTNGVPYYKNIDPTDANGKITVKLDKDTAASYKSAKVQRDPSMKYIVDKNQTYSFVNGELTITLKAYPSYTIRVVDQNGDAVVGARVQMCIPGGLCVSFGAPTDDNGESVKNITENSYEAQITSLPDGYTDAGEYHAFSGNASSGFTVTIVVTKN